MATKNDVPGIRITPRTLKALGCREVEKGRLWELKTAGYVFNILQMQGVCTDGEHAYDFGGCETSDGWQCNHSVTHVDELIGFAFGDGWEGGKKEFKRDLAEFLDVPTNIRD